MKTQQFIVGILLILLLVVMYAGAVPTGPTSITAGASSRGDITESVKSVTAQAGNTTEINISANTLTSAWQGYFGQISGDIVLADASNNNFYNWTMTTPSGEVYASPNNSITWTDIYCFNYTADGEPAPNLTGMESQFGMTGTDADGINETFNTTNPANITIGSKILTTGSCHAAYVYNNAGYQTTNFLNFLVTDNESLVFGTTISADNTGFNGNTYDFQLLVAENGHGAAASTTTTYYFWVELN